jgi:hypothetical protein
MLRVITMTAFRRPEYTREVLAALARCDGIGNWLLLPNIEPGHDDVIAAFREWNATESQPLVNFRRRGLNRNTHEVLTRALHLGADIIVHLEDDRVPSPDAMRYFEWAVMNVLVPNLKSSDGQEILLASGYNKPLIAPPTEQGHACQTRPIWSPWGWAVDRSRLMWLIDNWCMRNKRCFTCHFKACYRHVRREVFPILSRVQNIGYELGENRRSVEWYRANHRTSWVADETVKTEAFWLADPVLVKH